MLGQHREAAALRGKGWGRRHSTVDYVFTHSPHYLYRYHLKIMQEMMRRGYRPDPRWFDPLFRGNAMPPHEVLEEEPQLSAWIYPEHDEVYLRECLVNLEGKGIVICLEPDQPLTDGLPSISAKPSAADD